MSKQSLVSLTTIFYKEHYFLLKERTFFTQNDTDMKIEKDKVVTLFYSLQDTEGKELENNYNDTPMAYLHGHGNIFAALESGLEGLEIDATKKVTLEADDAYGQRRPNSVQKVPIKHLLGKPKKLVPGQLVKVNTEKGARDGSVIKAGRFMVELDFNHPLAGSSVVFDVKITDIRDATDEELAHGHAHGLGGHHH